MAHWMPHSTAHLVPPHGVTEPAKRDALASSMEANGWNGRPLLAVQDGDDDPVMLLTGSHRYAAARKAGLDDVPVYVLDAWLCGWTINGEDIYDERGQRICRDDDLLEAVRRTEDPDAISLIEQECEERSESNG